MNFKITIIIYETTFLECNTETSNSFVQKHIYSYIHFLTNANILFPFVDAVVFDD